MTRLLGELKEIDADDQSIQDKLSRLSKVNKDYTSLLELNHKPLDYKMFNFKLPEGPLIKRPFFGVGLALNWIVLQFRVHCLPYLILLFLVHWPLWLFLNN